MSMKPGEISQYLDRARELGVVPNFWLSKEYLSIQNAQLKTNGKVIWVEEDEWAVFPPLPLHSDTLQKEYCPRLKVWSDFENFSVGERTEFLDWEYTYAANHFLDLSGGRWKVFRKNSRKWPRANEGRWSYTSYSPPCKGEIEKLLMKWLERRDGEIEDSESLLYFAFNGVLRGFLRRGRELVGMNVWDCNDPFLMYRYCIVDPEEPFLDEFCRLLFYQSVPGWVVIDGGCLGNPGLERFKDKLNPIKKRAIYSRAI